MLYIHTLSLVLVPLNILSVMLLSRMKALWLLLIRKGTIGLSLLTMIFGNTFVNYRATRNWLIVLDITRILTLWHQCYNCGIKSRKKFTGMEEILHYSSHILPHNTPSSFKKLWCIAIWPWSLFTINSNIVLFISAGVTGLTNSAAT